MSESITSKKPCITCKKNGGILTCEGCQQIFCGKHVIEHRHGLAGQLDNLMQDYDSLQHEIERISMDQLELQKIDQWEKEYINKIQTAAETTRQHLRGLAKQSKEGLSQACHDIAVDICSSREADDYSEKDLIHWVTQLKELKVKTTSQSVIHILEEQKSITHLITTNAKDTINKECASSKPIASSIKSDIREHFSSISGSITLDKEGYLATHSGSGSKYVYISGKVLYSQGSHTIRFKLEKVQQPYRIFFGCISSKTTLVKDVFGSRPAVGWFGSNQVYAHGYCETNCNNSGYNSSSYQTNDVLHVTFNYNGKKQIALFNERLGTTSVIQVDIKQTPYPWKLLVVLFHKNDCVKMLK